MTQTSPRAIVNWGSFSIGQGNGVTFDQPNASSAILNRVTGSTTSTIAGQLQANGQVYLVNPNGIAITPTGAVRVGGGFVASTLGISDSDFNAGNLRLLRQGRLGGRRQRRLDRSRFRRLRRPDRRNGVEFGRRLGSARKGRDGLGRAGDSEPDRRQFSAGRRPDGCEDGRRQGAGRRFRQGSRRGRTGRTQGGDGGESDPRRGQCAGRTLGRFGPRERRRDHSQRRSAAETSRSTGRLDASGRTKGGAIAINGHDVALKRAKLAASSASGRGGSVTVTGTNAVSLASTSVDASGATGGGAIRIGGDFHGASDLASARTTTINSASTLNASATALGRRRDGRRLVRRGRPASPARSRRPAAPTAAMAAMSKSPPIPPPTACSTSPAAPT